MHGTLPLFTRPDDAPDAAAADGGDWLFGDEARDPDGLRWYQREAYEAVLREFGQHRSTLVVAATGTGKTRLFSTVAKHWPGRVLVLAHRDELVQQARRAIEKATQEWVEVEQAQFHCSPGSRLVVGSVQSLCKRKRIETLGEQRFDLVIIDEFHHATSPSYRAIMDYFAGAKVLGVTATPDRGDKKALGQVVQSVAYNFDLEAGIDNGYLVPIHGRRVELQEINLDGVKKTAGDLAIAQLDEAMLKAVEGIVVETLRLEPEKQCIFFWPGVKSAELACERCNVLKPGSSIFIHAGTDEDERPRQLREFHAGRYQYFHNVGIATEGFDAPLVDCIVMGRPTLSRSLYAQMVGRATRPLDGLVDQAPDKDRHDIRRELIAQSKKPHCIVLDFVGNGSKHSLVSVVDILGGKYTEKEVARAKKKAKEKQSQGLSPRELLEKARAELRAIASSTKAAKVKSSVTTFDPFGVMHMDAQVGDTYTRKFGYTPASKAQVDRLLSLGLKESQLATMSAFDAARFIATQDLRRKKGLCTYKQLVQLQKFGINHVNVTFERAKAAMTYLQQKDWGRSPIDPVALDKIIHHRREPGEDA